MMSILRKIEKIVRAWMVKADYFFLKLFRLLPFLRVIPYLFSKTFRNEYYVYLNGKEKYLDSLHKSRSANLYMLRRNIHRIEKGLLSKNIKDVFALAYIMETVVEYKRLSEICELENLKSRTELRWAHDVLTQYFSLVKSHPVVDKARTIFDSVGEGDIQDAQCVPYKRDLSKEPSVSFEDFKELSQRRRAVRWYLDKPVPRELVDKAMEVAAMSPSACNRQPFRVLLFDEKELIKKLGSIPLGFKEYYDKIPMLAVVVGQQRAYINKYDRHTIYVDASLAVMSFLYSLETLGLSSCAINWTDRPKQVKEINEIIHLDNDERVVMFIAIGYPDPEGSVASSSKKSLEEIRSYNK